MKKYSNKEYEKMVMQKAPPSPIVKNCIWAFVIGGLICVVGQLIADYYKTKGFSKEAISTATAVILVFLGAFFTGLGWYDSLAKYAGAGTIVPITGFANAIVSPAMEFKREGYVLGVAAKMFAIAGPVLVFGISVSVFAGLVYYIIR